MKSFQFAAAVFVLCCSSLVGADERGTLIFEDDFERSESQEQKDEIGNLFLIFPGTEPDLA
ncbi:MAG: hypothetical protein RLO18_08400, partial [Gimesia chilikensis]